MSEEEQMRVRIGTIASETAAFAREVGKATESLRKLQCERRELERDLKESGKKQCGAVWKKGINLIHCPANVEEGCTFCEKHARPNAYGGKQ